MAHDVSMVNVTNANAGNCNDGLDDPTIAPNSTPVVEVDGESTALPTAGCRVDEYVILGEIARGAMGVVFRAKHQSLDRVVALKMVIDGESDQDLRQRFANEARAAAKLDHPGIVPVYDVGQWRQFPYFAMLYVEGESLAQLLHHGPLPPPRAATIARRISDAIEHAHQHMIIHRDLKPANVLIDGHGVVRVTDFGVSKIMNAANDLTQRGELIGTPHFMPPEQAGQSTEQVGPTADVYSIGAVLYAMLTGRPPFQAASPLEVVAQVISQDAVPPSVLNPSVPIELEVITMKCLSKRTVLRYASAQELSADLQRYLAGEPILARPPGWLQKFSLLFRKHVIFASVSGTASLLLVFLTAALFLSWMRAQRNVAELTDQLNIAERVIQSERRVTHKFISRAASFANHDVPANAVLADFQIKRLAASAEAQSESNPNLALQLAIAAIELAIEHDQRPPEKTLTWLKSRINPKDQNATETDESTPAMSVQDMIKRAAAFVVDPVSEPERQLYGIAPSHSSDLGSHKKPADE
tara:strand:- start:14367 stop:15947 length:1581 start_codon:yes stop_codon:yes gene_type:complete